MVAPVETPAPVQPDVQRNPSTPPNSFLPRPIPPLTPNQAAPGEGLWTPIPNTFDTKSTPMLYKTFLHPDPVRPYAQIAIVALDATRLRLHVVAGTQEPVSSARVPRTGLIPSSEVTSLVAAFNGGFRAIHGQHGMMVDGQTLLSPLLESTTIAMYRDGRMRSAPWSVISDTLSSMQSFRQTPGYLAMQGQINPELQNERNFLWGKSVSGKTVIWRSALGISADGRTLYYGAGESLTVQHLAAALVAAGASNVAELDVNWAFERFLMYTPSTINYAERVLIDQMIYEPGMYVTRPSTRDFFYVTLGK